jgi:hypothetical protein
MKPVLTSTLPALLLIAICSCKQKSSTSITDTADTLQKQTPTITTGSYKDYLLFKKDIAGYSVTVVGRNALADSDGYFNHDVDGNFIFIRDLKTNKLDSLKLESIEDIDDPTVIDLSDSLKFKKPAFMIRWTGDSDIEMNEFVSYRNDSLKTIFILEDIVSLKRTDASTIKGFVRNRDEITYWFQDDYPVTISVKDGTVDAPLPPVQYLGVSTFALQDIKAYRMRGQKDSVPYTIGRLTDLKVDTLYRARNTVRLIIADSIIVHATPEALHLKIQANNAG